MIEDVLSLSWMQKAKDGSSEERGQRTCASKEHFGMKMEPFHEHGLFPSESITSFHHYNRTHQTPPTILFTGENVSGERGRAATVGSQSLHHTASSPSADGTQIESRALPQTPSVLTRRSRQPQG